MAARTSSRNARYLALLALAILLASAYLIVRPFKLAGVPDRPSVSGAEGAPSVEPPSVELDSTAASGRAGMTAAPGIDASTAPAQPGAPAVDFEVEVVDPDGKPVAGVTVSVTWPREESTLAVARTDEAGRATLHVEEEWIARDEKIHIGTPLVGTTPPYVECTLSTPPPERIRLVLEPAGSIELVLVGGGNIEFTAEDECRLDIDDDRCGTERSAVLHESAALIPLTSRSLVVPRVRTGLCFEASTRVRGLRFDFVRFDGPRVDGERVRVEVPFLGARALIRGRCVDPRGTPLSEHTFDLVAPVTEQGGQTRTVVEGATDETGRLHVFADIERLPKRGAPVEIHAARGGERSSAGRLQWPEPIDALTPESGPTIDLGDIVLETLPLLATGRIVDAHGKPTWGWVEMRVIRDSNVSWSSMEQTYTGADGSFQVTRAYPTPNFELRAMSYGKAPGASVVLAQGARDVLLTLREASRISGRVLLPAGIGIDQLDFDFTCIDPADEPHRRVSSYDWFADGSFYADRLLSGVYRFAVTLGEDELAAREAIIPEEGGSVTLEPIDLRELVHAIRLTVVAEGSDRVHEGGASIVHGEDRVSGQSLTRDGNAVLIARTKTVDVVAWVPGFRLQYFAAVESGARLVLERGFPTRLCLEPALEVPEPWLVRLDLRWQGEGALAAGAGEIQVPLEKDGCAGTDLPASGTYRVFAHLVRRGDRRGSESAFEQRLEIERSLHRGPEDVVVRVDTAALRKAIDEAQRK